ncbi:fructokinase [Listeria floridensis FSL S10-1187]|uniref:fructokinase n=1 Tax=Listeria floridensis FSL S10-1187 TaxID=1265817 RepID=A0ABP3AYN9_9LIST|nr:ROK family protein [Listeria floridensis]EUJ32418.1 fructokinase [Listeria floridensis FSL S10-1187]
MIGAIEAGGTKIVCAVADRKELPRVAERISIPTRTPEETLPKIVSFFKQYPVEAIGIGSFGPIDVNQDSSTYGFITNTPKLAWRNFDFLGAIRAAFDLPYFWTTDVNAAAFGEQQYGAARFAKNSIYITVGTGIGGGVILNGKVMEGRGHPEIGHIYINQLASDPFEGNCPYHSNCLEGLAAGPAIEVRAGQKAEQLNATDALWQIEAHYLAQACVNYTLSFAPEVIVFGGGVMKQTHLFPLIQEQFQMLLGGYMETTAVESFIVPCKLRDNAGIVGSLALAEQLI